MGCGCGKGNKKRRKKVKEKTIRQINLERKLQQRNRLITLSNHKSKKK